MARTRRYRMRLIKVPLRSRKRNRVKSASRRIKTWSVAYRTRTAAAARSIRSALKPAVAQTRVASASRDPAAPIVARGQQTASCVEWGAALENLHGLVQAKLRKAFASIG